MKEDYGNRDWEQPCVCGHLREMHPGLRYSDVCEGCWKSNPNRTRYKIIQQSCKSFKLDNLALIEQVARARRLV